MVVSYAPLGPVMFLRGFPPLPFAAYRPHNSQNHAIFAAFGGSRYKWIYPELHQTSSFIMFRGLVVVKSLISANFFQKMTLKSMLFYLWDVAKIHFSINSELSDFHNFQNVQWLDHGDSYYTLAESYLTDIDQVLEGSDAVKWKIIGFWQMANKGLLINNIIITYSTL